MQENQLKNILGELYVLDPSLKNYELELIGLITKMKDIKPDTKFDSVFAAELKEKIMAQSKIAFKDSNKKIFNFSFMNKKIFIATGSLAAIGIVTLTFFVYYQKGYLPTKNIGEKREVAGVLIDSSLTKEGFITLSDGAFGSLASLNTGTGTPSTISAGSANGTGELASAKVSTSNAVAPTLAISNKSISLNTASPKTLVSSEGAISGRMIVAPQYNFKYVYKGDALNLKEETALVYRRLKGDRTVAKELAASFSGLDSLGFGLSSLDNLKVTNISLVEDKDLGLMINFDFNEDNIYISENYTKWTYPERDACGSDQNCLDKYRMKIENIPADQALIAITDKFLSDHKIDRSHYGEPQVDNSWRDAYNKSEDKVNYYIPESATITYPLMINGQAVDDQSGAYVGLRVTVDLLKNAVSGLGGLTPYRYETSNYSLETSADTIIKTAENGGWNRNYYAQSENVQTIELGTPERAYVQVYKYENNSNEELLVPALIFPVINLPENSVYYGNKSIVVPLVPDLLKEIDNQPVPMYRTMMEGGTVNGSSGSVGVEATPASEPVLKR
jgi:hypothetical protein